MFFSKPSRLRDYGLLGMNQRNVAYISRYNPRRLYPRVDDKMETKVLAESAGIAVPKAAGRGQHAVSGKRARSGPRPA
jgi:hypothetical protein